MSVQENLDARIERIRKRDAEIEKRHREAEADRLQALKENAMVKTKPPSYNDWPKAHKYDTVDFTYDVKDENLKIDVKLPSHKPATVEKSQNTNTTARNRDFKKFAAGEGPPPDPSYNFLADAERDGITDAANNVFSDKKDSNKKFNSKIGAGGNISGHNNNNNFRNRGGLNNSFKGKSNQLSRNSSNTTNQSKHHRYESNNESSHWSTNRDKNEDGRLNRQKAPEGKWRRDDRPNEIVIVEQDTNHHKKFDIQSPNIDNQFVNQQKVFGSIPRNQMASNHLQLGTDLSVKTRGNVTVSVSQDGEVRSVKLQSAKAIGTGRVGLRQNTVINPFITSQCFQADTIYSIGQPAMPQAISHSQMLPQQNIQYIPSIPIVQHPTITHMQCDPNLMQAFQTFQPVNGTARIDLYKPSKVQDRLNRIREQNIPKADYQLFDGNMQNGAVNTATNQQESAPIAVGY